MEIREASEGFAAVGAEARLAVLLALVRQGPKGLTVGELQTRLGTPASTLAHHLRILNEGGLISQEKHGRQVINRANFSKLKNLADYLLNECCVDAENGC
ncbi:MAG: metalloregulator ArsR/SmtB family transcription factor [Granulosicoccus sp.]|nr:metalloregulator ArsR/SmtB family transcription factor [Granulosicoccus sp.]